MLGWMVNATAWLHYPQEKEPVPIVEEAGWAASSIWFGAENLTPIGIRSPDCPASRYTVIVCRIQGSSVRTRTPTVNHVASQYVK